MSFFVKEVNNVREYFIEDAQGVLNKVWSNDISLNTLLSILEYEQKRKEEDNQTRIQLQTDWLRKR